MTIDFSLMRIEEVGAHAVVGLWPGHAPAAATRASAVFVSAAAFTFIEPCISQSLGGTGTLTRRTCLPLDAAQWQAIRQALATLADSLRQAKPSGAHSGLGLLIPYIQAARVAEFARTTPALCALLDALGAWLDATLAEHPAITLLRV